MACFPSVHHLPVFTSLDGYRTNRFSADLFAGLTVWAVMVPEALAYASLAGVSPVVGLYAVPGALLLYAAFGSSRHLIVGPMSATAALSAATVSEFAAPGAGVFLALTTTIAILAGLVALLAAALKLGFIANFISIAVLKGFIIGLALTIIAGQLGPLVGIEQASGDFFDKCWGLITSLDQLHVWTALIGVASLALVLYLRQVAARVPASLLAVVFGVAIVSIFGLDGHGVAVVGEIEGGLPDIGLPGGVTGSDVLDIAPGTVAILIVGFVEGLGAAKSYAATHGYEIDPDQELVGIGAANLGAGLSGGMVVNGSLSKTAVNAGAGATSQVAGLVVAALTLATLLLFAGLFEDLPQATLAAVVIAALIDLVDIPGLRRFYDIRSRELGRVLGPAARADFFAAAVTLAGVLLFDILTGLFLGIAVSMVLLVYRAYRPRMAQLGRVPGTDQFGDVALNPQNLRVPGLVIVRVEAGLFFANADGVRQRIEELAQQPNVLAVLLDAEAVSFVDLTAAEMLVQLEASLRRRGKQLALAGEIGQVREFMEAAEPEANLPAYTSVAEAVAEYERETGLRPA